MAASGSGLRTAQLIFPICGSAASCVLSICGDDACDADGVGVSFFVVSISVGNSVTDVGDVATDVVVDAVV